MQDAERKLKIHELNRQLINLNKYVCDCGASQANENHYWFCAIEMADIN